MTNRHLQTQFLDRPSGRLAYDITGEGPLVVAMTGMGDVRAQYRFVVEQLVAEGYRVATVDVRGFGESSVHWDDYSHAAIAEDYLAVIRELGGPAVLLASSYAGGAAAVAALDESVVGIVLLAGVINRAAPTKLQLLMLKLLSAPMTRLLWGSYYASLYPSRKPDDFAAHKAAVVANVKQKGRWANIGRMVLSDNSATLAVLPKVAVPSLLVYGLKDPDFTDPREEVEWLQSQLPNSESLLIEGAGHYPHVERDDLVQPVLNAFLERTCRARA